MSSAAAPSSPAPRIPETTKEADDTSTESSGAVTSATAAASASSSSSSSVPKKTTTKSAAKTSDAKSKDGFRTSFEKENEMDQIQTISRLQAANADLCSQLMAVKLELDEQKTENARLSKSVDSLTTTTTSESIISTEGGMIAVDASAAAASIATSFRGGISKLKRIKFGALSSDNNDKGLTETEMAARRRRESMQQSGSSSTSSENPAVSSDSTTTTTATAVSGGGGSAASSSDLMSSSISKSKERSDRDDQAEAMAFVIKAKQSEIRNLSKTNSSLRSKVTDLSKSNEKMKENLAALRKERDALMIQLTSKVDECEQMKKQHKIDSDKWSELLLDMTNNSQASLAQKSESMAKDYRSQLSAIQEEKSQLERQIESMERLKASDAVRFEKVLSERNSMTKKIKSLQSDLAQALSIIQRGVNGSSGIIQGSTTALSSPGARQSHYHSSGSKKGMILVDDEDVSAAEKGVSSSSSPLSRHRSKKKNMSRRMKPAMHTPPPALLRKHSASVTHSSGDLSMDSLQRLERMSARSGSIDSDDVAELRRRDVAALASRSGRGFMISSSSIITDGDTHAHGGDAAAVVSKGDSSIIVDETGAAVMVADSSSQMGLLSTKPETAKSKSLGSSVGRTPSIEGGRERTASVRSGLSDGASHTSTVMSDLLLETVGFDSTDLNRTGRKDGSSLGMSESDINAMKCRLLMRELKELKQSHAIERQSFMATISKLTDASHSSSPLNPAKLATSKWSKSLGQMFQSRGSSSSSSSGVSSKLLSLPTIPSNQVIGGSPPSSVGAETLSGVPITSQAMQGDLHALIASLSQLLSEKEEIIESLHRSKQVLGQRVLKLEQSIDSLKQEQIVNEESEYEQSVSKSITTHTHRSSVAAHSTSAVTTVASTSSIPRRTHSSSAGGIVGSGSSTKFTDSSIVGDSLS